MSEPRGPALARKVRSRVPTSLEDLLRHTRRQLLEYALGFGLTGTHRLTKAVLATRVQHELEKMADAREPADAPRKFDLGLTPAEADDEMKEDIPWGYGQDRVTAMAIDPERLYLYWEITDEALERVRTELGPGGRGAWLNLRVYDVTNRIFDGTNARSYIDHSVSRTDRQWFFLIGKPSSTAVVEVGLKSEEGYFVRIARSGRADFPRRDPASAGRLEWLTVRSASGEVGEPAIEHRETHAVISGGAEVVGQPEPVRVWDIRRTHGGEWIMRDASVGSAWQEEGAWVHERTIEWEGPIIRTTWEAGPFSDPVELVGYVEERYEGPVTVRFVEGGSHIVHGPWQVVIRGLGARAERRILGVWEIQRSWLAGAGIAMRTAGGAVDALGGSEQMALGASELRWRAASELRLGGASELYRLGASELLYLGASEMLYAGASEWRFLGASEWRERGASEARFAGASEQLYPGASERTWPGASENRPHYPAEPSPSG